MNLPIVFCPPQELLGATEAELAGFYPGDRIRQIERASIRAFMEQNRGYLKGRVLDFGAGKQPYRDLVDGEYVPYEKGDTFPTGLFDAAMMNQVIQYVDDPMETMRTIFAALKPKGVLVMTGPTNWTEIEETDLWRFTMAGIRTLVTRAGFRNAKTRPRAHVYCTETFEMSLGWGLLAAK